MSIVARIGSSFREELRRPNTQAYMVCTTLVLLVGVLAWKGIWTGSERSLLMQVLQVLIPISVLLPMSHARDQFWKRLGIVLAIHAVFFPLYLLFSGKLMFAKTHEQLAMWICVILMLGEATLIIAILNKFFPREQAAVIAEGEEF